MILRIFRYFQCNYNLCINTVLKKSNTMKQMVRRKISVALDFHEHIPTSTVKHSFQFHVDFINNSCVLSLFSTCFSQTLTAKLYIFTCYIWSVNFNLVSNIFMTIEIDNDMQLLNLNCSCNLNVTANFGFRAKYFT